jgi:methionine aminopeptidase
VHIFFALLRCINFLFKIQVSHFQQASQLTIPSLTFHHLRAPSSNPDLNPLRRTQLHCLVYRSDPEASRTLAKDDVVKIQLGAHIDGFAAISAETVVIGASAENPVTGRRADVIKAAWTAAEAAMRTVKVGNKNWAVTEVVARSADAFHCKPVEGL